MQRKAALQEHLLQQTDAARSAGKINEAQYRGIVHGSGAAELPTP
jgi:hypothetical protein